MVDTGFGIGFPPTLSNSLASVKSDLYHFTIVPTGQDVGSSLNPLSPEILLIVTPVVEVCPEQSDTVTGLQLSYEGPFPTAVALALTI